MTHVYHHAFPNGLIATATVTSDPPGFAVEWAGTPDRTVIAEYRAWRKLLMNDYTRRFKVRIEVVEI
jgi:hypothetical protein